MFRILAVVLSLVLMVQAADLGLGHCERHMDQDGTYKLTVDRVVNKSRKTAHGVKIVLLASSNPLTKDKIVGDKLGTIYLDSILGNTTVGNLSANGYFKGQLSDGSTSYIYAIVIERSASGTYDVADDLVALGTFFYRDPDAAWRREATRQALMGGYSPPAPSPFTYDYDAIVSYAWNDENDPPKTHSTPSVSGYHGSYTPSTAPVRHLSPCNYEYLTRLRVRNNDANLEQEKTHVEAMNDHDTPLISNYMANSAANASDRRYRELQEYEASHDCN
jgi:hypothetical protein